jgi:transposase
MAKRYEPELKQGAIKLVTEQGRNVKEVATELGIHPETLRLWIRELGLNPTIINKSNKEAKRIKDLEAQLRELKRQVTEKDEVIDILKKSVGIISKT